MTTTDITKLNELFGKLQSWYHKGNFTDDQELQICLAIKSQLDTSNPIHQRVNHHTFKPVPTRIGEHASKIMAAFALDEEAHVSALRAGGYVLTPETVKTPRAPSPGPSGLTADGNLRNKSENSKGKWTTPKVAKPNPNKRTICGNDLSFQPSTEGEIPCNLERKYYLHTVKHGPYRVINHKGNVYTVEHLVKKVIRDFHVTLLIEYKHDENNTNVDKVAKIDDEYADMVNVLDHRYIPPNSKKRSSLEFLLTWEDDRKVFDEGWAV